MNFDYIKPNTLTDALEYLEKENAAILAGGTDMVVNLKSGKINPSFLIDIKGLKELKGIVKVDGGIFIGALTTIDDIKNSPLLSRYRALVEGAGVLGCLEIRYRATIGGNICNGSPSADTVPGLLVYNAKVEIISKHGSRIIPLENFLIEAGKVDLRKGELLKGVLLPDLEENSSSRYYRVSRVKGMDLSSVAVAVYLKDVDLPVFSEIRIALGAVQKTVVRMKNAEQYLQGKPYTLQNIDKAIEIILSEINPRAGSLRATPYYKKKMVGYLIKEAIREMKGGNILNE